MKLKYLLLASLFVTFLSLGTPSNAQNEASKILDKMRQLDLMNQILPVLMTPEQINKVLPSIEKSRSVEKKLIAEELEKMKAFEPKVDAALTDAREKGLVPSKESQVEVMKLLQDMQKHRLLITIEQNEAVLKAVEETLDAGQIKAAANAITIPEAGSKLNDRDRLRRWVRVVLMDPLAYNLLVELSRKKGS